MPGSNKIFNNLKQNQKRENNKIWNTYLKEQKRETLNSASLFWDHVFPAFLMAALCFICNRRDNFYLFIFNVFASRQN